MILDMVFPKPGQQCKNEVHILNKHPKLFPSTCKTQKLAPSEIFHALAFTDNVSGAEVDNGSSKGGRSYFSIKACTQVMLLFGDGADGGLLEGGELSAGSENEAIVCDSGVAPKLLNWSLHAIDGDDNIGIGARLIVGKLDSSSQRLPPKLGGGCGEGNGGKERRGKRGGVGEVHFEWI